MRSDCTRYKPLPPFPTDHHITAFDLRKELRANKQYQFADMIRDRLKETGYVLEDTSDGVKWKKI